MLVQGIWRVALYNPMRTYPLAFNLTVAKQAICLNNCSDHGTCSEVRRQAHRHPVVLHSALWSA